MEVWLICSASESHKLAGFQSSARLFMTFSYSQHSPTHTHTHIWHKLAHLTIPLDSQSAINLKQTKIDRYCVSTTEEIMPTFHNESLHQAEYNLMYNQSPFEFQECTNSNIPKGAGKTH